MHKDTLKLVLIPCYNLSRSVPFLFSLADVLEMGSYDFWLWEVCWVMSANPAIFEHEAMQSVDG